MPCQSDYMNPTSQESESRKVAQLLCYVMPLMGMKPSDTITKSADDYYGNVTMIDIWTSELCKICSNMSEAQSNQIIYNGRNRDARRLADWWELHQELDKLREIDEKAARSRLSLREEALKKLSASEREALGL